MHWPHETTRMREHERLDSAATYDRMDVIRERNDVSERVSDDRPLLVRELDEVLTETQERIYENLRRIQELGNQLQEDWLVYRSSLQLRNRFASTPADTGLPGGLFPLIRAIAEFGRPSSPRGGSDRAQTVARAAGRRSSAAGAPPDRIGQIQRVLADHDGGPMDTDTITASLEARGWLGDVGDARATVSAALSRATRLGLVERVSRGTYQLPTPEKAGEIPEGGDRISVRSLAGKEVIRNARVPTSS